MLKELTSDFKQKFAVGVWYNPKDAHLHTRRPFTTHQRMKPEAEKKEREPPSAMLTERAFYVLFPLFLSDCRLALLSLILPGL